MRRSRSSDERGIALVLALFVLVVIGALVAAVFFTAQLEERTGANTVSGLQALQAADAGLEYASANWSRTWAQQGVGNTSGIDWIELGSTGGYFSDSITQLNDQLLMIRSFGEARNGAGRAVASRVSGMLFKVVQPDFGLAAAATVDGAVNVAGKDTLSGIDIVPSGGAWALNCASLTRSDQPGVRSSSTISTSGPKSFVTPSSTASDTSVATSVTKVNGLFSTLAGMADQSFSSATVPVSIAPVLSGHTCDRTQAANWGDPTYAPSGVDGAAHPCASYFPIVYVDGNMTIPNGSGQGILLVHGNLQFNSAFQFYGVILVTGTAKATGGSKGNIYGALLAESGTSNFTGNERLDYSSCAATLAAEAALIGRPLAARPYVRF
ncbi:MAG: PilX N-terminal domain-containing pilus assembly protein [Gemmatimonadales bacterium]